MNTTGADQQTLKARVQQFWDQQACGEVYALGQDELDALNQQAAARYRLEPYIHSLAQFSEGQDRDVLEIGVGMGADHLEWAKSGPRSLTGIDLTPRAIEYTRARLAAHGFASHLAVGDAEGLNLPDASMDIVYSWGVLHHTPDTPQAIREVYRVLRPGGTARLMLYHKYSIVGDLLWVRYALLKGKPGRTLREVYAAHLESPGTQAFTVAEARAMCAQFSQVKAWSQLSFGDLLQGEVGQRHRSRLLTLAKRFWPRGLIRVFLPHRGLMLMIEAVK